MPRCAQRFDARQSMQNNRFEIFHYRDKQPENIRIHHHDFYEVYFFLKGDVRFTVEGKNYVLTPGDLLLMNPMELHQAQIQKGTVYDRIVLWMDCDYLKSLGGAEANLAECFDRSQPYYKNFLQPDKLQQTTLLGLLEKLNTEFYGDHFGSAAYAQGILMQLMVEINRLVHTALDKNDIEENDMIIEVLNYIGEHYAEPITLESLANTFFVSKYHLSHEFHARVGTSIYRYVIFHRLMQAKEMLASGVAAGTVYTACGFGDYANFYRAFKAEYGISPKQFALTKK